MPSDAERSPRPRFTVVVEPVGDGAWQLNVRERPASWTVAFAADEIEQRAIDRITLDTGLRPDEFDVEIDAPPPLFLERRAERRDLN
ncbi:MAG TPA: hypothetical protein VKA85_01660 [Candidatus Limnocylindrales bacterium]|nr:hypothetical protein [Candidatus Limnocylindrales bacterium]